MRGLIRYTRPNNLFDWDGLLDNFFTDTAVWNARTPAVDVRETDSEYQMEVELPGLTDKDIELNVEDNILTLSSKKEESKEEKKNGYLIRERRNNEFARTFVLPKDVERDKIKAEFKNGLLVVNIPKKPEAKPRKIDVKSN
ncbi:MAG: Hsp20/alpha crystallin family protein [Spirochaetaceae bacterium]|nr:MAG: Hsp20/alpha crystallin family protein [Spirochaetaceae bacterium]